MESRDIEDFYLRYGRIVYGYLLKCTYNESLAEELTQETFYQALLSIDRYKGACKPSVWLCQIAKHVWYKHAKKEKKYVLMEDDDLNLAAGTQPAPEQEILDRRDKLEVYKFIRLLPREMQEVIYLRLTGDLSFSEIGEIMNQSEVWARTNYYRAKEKLVREVRKNEA